MKLHLRLAALAYLCALSCPGYQSALLSAQFVDARRFGVFPSNPNNVAALNAAFAAAASSASGPGIVSLPAGTYKICSQINVPAKVSLVGAGAGDPPDLVPPNGKDTVIQACPTFPGAAPFPANMMVTVAGTHSSVKHLTVDCNNVRGCGALLNNHGHEGTRFEDVIAERFASYGLYVLGGGDNGPDTEIELLGGPSQNAGTQALVLNGVVTYHGFLHSTINMDSPPGTRPATCGWISGLTITLRDGHCEGPAKGFILGNPNRGNATDGLNQVEHLTVENFFGPATPGFEIIACTSYKLVNCGADYYLTFLNSGTIQDDIHLKNGSPAVTASGYYHVSDAPVVGQQDLFSLEPGDPITLNNPVLLNTGSLTLSKDTPFNLSSEIVLQPDTAPRIATRGATPPSRYFHEYVDPSGNFNLASQEGASLVASPDGSSRFGNRGVRGKVATFTNSSASCTIDPASTGLSCTSDPRVKSDFVTLPNELDRIVLLHPALFRWEGSQAVSGQHAGFIAQDVEKVFPDLVSKGDDGYLTLNEAGLVPYLVKAVQDLTAIVKRQQAEIDELKRGK